MAITYEIIAPKAISGRINLPASKSISNRVLTIAACAGAKSYGHTIQNLSDCDDTRVVKALFPNVPEVVDIGAAGTAMRFLTAFLSLREGETHIITGTDRMKHRPIKVLVDALRELGADIQYVGEEGFPPLRICGKQLKGGRLEIPGDVSSQYVSALLLIAPLLTNGLTLHLKGNIVSRPYIDLTLSVMQNFGADAEWKDNDDIVIRPSQYKSCNYVVENDWSAASYWYEMVAIANAKENIAADVELCGLSDGSRQGDSRIRYIFNLLGVKTVFAEREGITDVRLKEAVARVGKLEYDFVNQPDMAQTFVVTCCALGIPFHFEGLASLKIKETDRIEALKKELHKVGFVLEERNASELLWNGERCEPTGEAIDTYEDHRMALSFAPLAIALGSVKINNPEVVSKSYPTFWDDLRQAGFQVNQL